MIYPLRIILLAGALTFPLLPATARLVPAPGSSGQSVAATKTVKIKATNDKPTQETRPDESGEAPKNAESIENEEPTNNLQLPSSPEPSKPTAPSEPEPIVPTVIETDHAEMVTRDGQTHLVLTGNVKITGNNLVVLCDQMEVFTVRREPEEEEGKQEDPSGITSPEFGQMEKIIAIGNVQIEQEGRQGQAGRAEIYLIEGRIELTESPVISDENGTVSGHRITFNQGEARAVVEAGEGQRARIVLPTLPDLGAATEKRSTENGKSSK